MTSPFSPRIGGIPSADIAVPEHEREQRFYARVLTTGESPLWRDDLMNDQGHPVIGLGARTEEYADLPLQWMPHIQVADVATSVERALALNGRELMHGKDDEGASQWAVLLDPNGAAFGIVPVVPAEEPPSTSGVEPTDAAARTGCISWIELTVSDAPTTRDFYQQVVGWSVQDVQERGASERATDHVMRADDGSPVAGIRRAHGAHGGLPRVWTIHLPVGDLDESLRRVRDEGGRIVQETSGADGRCASAIVEDPVGVVFALERA